MKRGLICFLLVLILVCLVIPTWCYAEEPIADEISSEKLVTDYSGFSSLYYLFDENEYDHKKTQDTSYLTLTHEDGIGSLYFIFAETYGTYTVVNHDTGAEITAGENHYLHEYVNLMELFGKAPQSVTIRFDHGAVALNELYVYGVGNVPDTVQKWELPADGKTDMILFSTHSDDDHLYFAGLLPYYAVERGFQVQVVYLTNHWNVSRIRVHEALDGLWAVGIRSYPVFGPYPDFNCKSIDDAYKRFQDSGFSREQMTGFVVEQLRRFKPQVVVGHDFNGEYGHVQHKVYAQLLANAVEISNDALSYPETAEQYGVWDVPKTYIHLYEQNKVYMDWDKPMESFGGLTPYEVARDIGFAAHVSQHRDWSSFFNPKTAADIFWHSPCKYGLYRTTVGLDVNGDDLFENIIHYAEQERLAQEEAARVAAEEAARREAEEALRAAEEAQRLAEEQARLEAEEKARQEEAQRLAELQRIEKQKQIQRIGLIAVVLLVSVIVICTAFMLRRKKK